MKILLVTPIYPSSKAPLQGIYIKRINDILLELSHEVKLVTYKSGSNLVQKFLNLFRFLRSIRKEVKTNNYDIINIQYPFISPLAFLCLKVEAKIVTTLHGTDVKHDSMLRRILDPITKKLLIKSDKLIVNTQYFRSFVANKYNINENKIIVCPAAGYDEKIFYPDKEKIENIQRGASDKAVFNLGFVGRFVDKKGWQVALDALEIFYKKLEADTSSGALPRINLNFIGAGNDRDSMLEKCQALNKQYTNVNVEVNSILIDDDLANFYRSLDLFLFPTLFEESLGLVAIESLACGVPVAASNIGAIPEYISHHDNGYLFPAGSAQDLAEDIIEYYNLDQKDKTAMCIRAFESVQEFKRSEIKNKMNKVLTEILSDA